MISGASAALLNLLPLHFYCDFNILLGPFIAILVAAYIGPIAGLFVSFIATIPIVITWNFAGALPIFMLESLFVSYFYNRIWKNLIVTVFIYWLIVGMPAWWLLIKQSQIIIDSHVMLSTMNRLINSILYAHIAVIFSKYEKFLLIFNSKKSSGLLSLKKKYSQQLSVIFVTFGIILVFYNLYTSAKNINSDQSRRQSIQHAKIEGELNTLIHSRKSAMNELSRIFSNVWFDDELRNQILRNSYRRMSDYITMILADKNAKVISFYHGDDLSQIDISGINNIADRDYFQFAINTDKPYVSNGFQGRGLGNDLIAVISCGIPAPDSKGNIGIIQGAMALGKFKSEKKLFNNSESYTGILLDQNNKVLFSSDSLDIKELDKVTLKAANNQSGHNKGYLIIDSTPKKEVQYTFIESRFEWGWKLISLQDDSIVLRQIEKLLFYYSLALLALAFLSEAAAHLLSSYWTKQLTLLTNEVKNFDIDDDKTLSHISTPANLPEELAVLYKALKTSKEHVKNVNKNLKKTVRKKTKQLKKSNEKLIFLANHDYLTGLYNRRFFDNELKQLWKSYKKTGKKLSIFMVDIDYFKKVNDNWGHPVGDIIIQGVGSYLGGIRNEKLLFPSRHGGEEFAIISTEQSQKKILQMAHTIQEEISTYKFDIGSEENNQTIQITVSLGVATIDTTKDNYNQLYRLADKALYQAKSSGRNCVRFLQA